ncbi:putative immunity protein [Streptomyces sp. NPDC001595]|uniref:putative immunity protein n=1 Tax=Streptomyces sp. NPDC001532 TaxID=3154520 RepID=UPI00331E84E1
MATDAEESGEAGTGARRVGAKTTGGKTTGGKTAGGKTAGGKTAGGKTAGAKTTGGKTAGGKTAGGKTTGGKTAGAEGIGLSDTELREIAGYAADCASRVLPVFERSAPADTRPRDAVDAARAFADGGRRTTALRQSAWAAYKAAQEATLPAAVDAARAASHAAAAAFLHPKASAHQVKHILGAAAHAARAEELAAGEDEQVAAAALERARRHAPAAVAAVLGRLPAAPSGGGRVGGFIRELDAALRA